MDSQASTGALHHNFVTSMVNSGNTVGWHWFNYQDDTNFGSASELLVKNASASFYREAYLRFDVSSLSTGVSSAVSAQTDRAL